MNEDERKRRYKRKIKVRNVNLAFYCISKNNFNLKKAKTEYRKFQRERYKANPSDRQIATVFTEAQADMEGVETETFKNLRRQLLVTAQDVLARAANDYEETGDLQEMLDALRFYGELANFINNNNTTVNINQDNSQNMELNVDELILSLQGGMDRISPILEKVRSLSGLSGGESPFYIHPSRETEALVSIPSERDMGTRGKSQR